MELNATATSNLPSANTELTTISPVNFPSHLFKTSYKNLTHIIQATHSNITSSFLLPSSCLPQLHRHLAYVLHTFPRRLKPRKFFSHTFQTNKTWRLFFICSLATWHLAISLHTSPKTSVINLALYYTNITYPCHLVLINARLPWVPEHLVICHHSFPKTYDANLTLTNTSATTKFGADN